MTLSTQRYSKIPPLEEFEVADNVGIAFDFTTVAPNTIDVIRQTYPALKIFFKEALEDILNRKDVFKFKRIDQAIEASLNMEETYGDDGEEIDGNKHKRAKLSGNSFSKKYSPKSNRKNENLKGN